MAEEVVISEEQELSELLQIRLDKLKKLQEEGKDPFQVTKFDRTDYSADIKDNFEAPWRTRLSRWPEGLWRAASWVKRYLPMFWTEKAVYSFIYGATKSARKRLPSLKRAISGDIIGVSGFVFKTKMGEISVHCQQLKLLAKSLRPLPEKFHGLTSTELKYRQRYVDLIVKPETRRAFEIRSRFIRHVRTFLDARGYMEVETPVLNTISGGATRAPVHYASQHTGHRYVSAHRHRASFKAAHRRRY